MAEARIDGHRVVLAKPRSYMNVSGRPVAALARFFSVPLDRLIVVHDELDIDFGVVRLKQGGGEGGLDVANVFKPMMARGDSILRLI